MKTTSMRHVFRRATLYLALAVTFIIVLGPVYWLFVTSASPTVDLMSYPPSWIPQHVSFDRFVAVLFASHMSLMGQTVASSSGMFRLAITNSLLVGLLTTALCLVIGTLSAYAFARLRFTGHRSLLLLMMAVQMLPPVVLVLPFYRMLRQISLIDNIAGLVIVYTSFLLVYVIWMMTGYFQSVPVALEEAARIDGCSRLGALVRVVLPVSLPGFAATIILCFLLSWDEFLFALVLTNVNARTMPVAIASFSTQYGVDYGMMATGGVLASIPPLLIVFGFQRFLVRGLTAGAVKG